MKFFRVFALLVLPLAVMFMGCLEEGVKVVPDAMIPEPTTDQVFTGQVFTVEIGMPAAADAIITVMAGPHINESVVTDYEGRYTFKNCVEEELHVRVEKAEFETKEVVVSRSGRTTLTDGTFSDLYSDLYGESPQNSPGGILIGHAWPSRGREFLDRVVVPVDLLLSIEQRERSGYSSGGIIRLAEKRLHEQWGPDASLAHEIAHAHQHAMVIAVEKEKNLDRSQWRLGAWIIQYFEETDEGKAYITARNKDWEEVGKAPYYDTNPHISGPGRDHECAAEICREVLEFDLDNRDLSGIDLELYPFFDLRAVAPNRAAWAEDWLFRK